MRQLWLDVDGVMADFHGPARELFGMDLEEFEEKYGAEEFWKRIYGTPDFYANLPLMHDAMELFEAVKHLNPILLTGCPRGEWGAKQKFSWRDKNFPGVPMITCLSKDKRSHAKPGDVLVDDWLRYRDLWVEMGGIFIHHRSAKESIEALREYFELTT